MKYRGRFAPTPSGPLHLGSLLTALASWLQARSNAGTWQVRIDDLDTPRCVAGSDDQILRQLEAHGLYWDEVPRYQSRHTAEYIAALDQLQARALAYPCSCSRADLAQASLPGPDGPVYAGTCRHHARPDRPLALRLRVEKRRWCCADAWLGPQCRELETEVGDFVLRRTDGLLAYQLASAVDEAAQAITEVVRGADLLGSSFRQSYLHHLLRLPALSYRHLPVLVNAAGLKLSKQNHARALDSARAAENLWRCLGYLQQQPPAELRKESVARVLQWALPHWQPQRLQNHARRVVEE